MREITKEVTLEIEGNEMTFVITKMNAFNGAYLMKFVTERLLPAVGELQDAMVIKDSEKGENEEELVKKRVQNILPMISKFLESISEEDLIKLEKNCLKTVQCKMPAGLQNVLNGDSFCIPELEYDVMNVLLLCYYVIEYNTQGFFGEKRLGSLLNRVGTSLPSA